MLIHLDLFARTDFRLFCSRYELLSCATTPHLQSILQHVSARIPVDHRDSVKEGAPLRPWPYRVATNERLPRKYVCGVVPSIVRNISMKALTLS